MREQACAFGGTQYSPLVSMSFCPADDFCRKSPASSPCAGYAHIKPYVSQAPAVCPADSTLAGTTTDPT